MVVGFEGFFASSCRSYLCRCTQAAYWRGVRKIATKDHLNYANLCSVVEFRTRDDMERAIRKLDGTELNGRKISLIEVGKY